MKIFFRHIFLLFSVLICFHAEAKHIIGGEVYYDCQGLDTVSGVVFIDYLITFRIYRDNTGGGAAFDDPGQFGLYRKIDNKWVFIEVYSEFIDSSNKVPVNDNPCVVEPAGIDVEEASYQFNIKIPQVNSSYLLVYQRCCRNNTILNIVEPEETGAVFQVEISALAQKICNDSPVFDNFPPVVICANTPLVFEHSATDVEGHELVYEFCTPITSGGTKGSNGNPGNPLACDGVTPANENCLPPYDEIIFKLPEFTQNNPLGTASNTSLNTFTGLLTANPTIVGQFVIGVCVKEYLNGELLSEVRRDFQFNVTECEILVYANIDNDEVIKEQEFLIRSCGDFSVDFVNQSQDEQYIEEYLWQFELGGGNVVTADTRDATINFPSLGEYFGQLIINPNSSGCRDTADIHVQIFPEINADYTFDYDTCDAGPVAFEDLSVSGAGFIQSWNWYMDVQDTITDQNHDFQFDSPGLKNVALEVTDINRCKDTSVQIVSWYPVPAELIVQPNTFFGCLPAEIYFNNLSFPIDDSYDINWSFGDGGTDTVISPTHTYNEVGIYSVDLHVVSPIGCEVSQSYPFWIKVEPSPVADFSYTPDIVTSNENIVSFTDQSEDAVSWQYIFNTDEGSYFQPDVTYTFQDTGLQKIDLVVLHPSGCPDTITKYIDVIPLANFFMPNAFSPNGDGVNDQFKGKGNLFGVQDFSMNIWNRWGELVYSSDDPTKGWDGRDMKFGTDVPSGVYVYQLYYIGPRSQVVNKKGTATLIR